MKKEQRSAGGTPASGTRKELNFLGNENQDEAMGEAAILEQSVDPKTLSPAARADYEFRRMDPDRKQRLEAQ
ncbi:unnamed protein product, partial [Amoebophrya sp. A25]|eukprot:GSA25T00012246001.1